MPKTSKLSKITVEGECAICNSLVTFKVKRLKADNSINKKDLLKCEMYGLICPNCNHGAASASISGGLTILPCSSVGIKYACPNGCNCTSNVPGYCKFCKAQLVKVSAI